MQITQEIGSKVRDCILINMSNYIDKESLNILEKVIEEQFVRLDIRELETLPATIDRSVDEQNKYFVQLFIIKKKNLSPKTVEMYLGSVKRLLTQVDKPLIEVTDLDISFYLRWYQDYNERQGGQKNRATTVNNERRFLSAFYTCLRKSKMIAENPVEATEPLKEEARQIDYFRPGQLENLRDGCENLRDRALIEGLRSTGLRVGEFEQIDITDIDFTTGDVIVKREKGGADTPAYLDEVAIYHIKAYLESRVDDNPALIVSIKKPYKRLEKAGIRSALKEIAKKQGMSCRVYPHKMRKTLGMTMINKGEDLSTVQSVLGHTDVRTTSRYYAKLTPETLRERRRRL